MSLNYDVACYVIDEDGNNIENAKIHAFFNQVDSASSSSQWDGDIRLTAGNGKVSFNLGDDSFLTSEGVIKTGDTILICAWYSENIYDDNDEVLDDKQTLTETITKCVTFIHTIDTSSSSYSEDFTLLDIKNPICDIDIPDVYYTGRSFTIINNSYISYGSYTDPNYDRYDLYQWTNYYEQDLFLGKEISTVSYDYGEAQLIDNSNEVSYAYIDTNDYTITITVTDYYGYYCYVTKDVHISYNKPIIDFDFTFTKLLNTDKHIGVGNDDLLESDNLSYTRYGDTWEQLQASFDWYLTDTDLDGNDTSSSELNNDISFVFQSTFNSPSTISTKNIKLVLNWNDGYDWYQEILEKEPIIDIYNILADFTWSTSKGYIKPDGPLGDDDIVTITTENIDVATQNYYSNTQWVSLTYDIINDTDNITFEYIKDNDDRYDENPSFTLTVYETTSFKETLVYNDGFQDVTRVREYSVDAQKYVLNNNIHYESLYGTNKVIINDSDIVSLYNDSYFTPQNNLDLISSIIYDIEKNKYTSYTDATIIDDSESFDITYDDVVTFYIRMPDTFNIKSSITFYNGFYDETVIKDFSIVSEVMTPIPELEWSSRYGINKTIIGRDDLCSIKNISILTDYYNTEYEINYSRCLYIDYKIENNITEQYFNTLNIGGDVYNSSEDIIEEYLEQDVETIIDINFWNPEEHNIEMTFYYNDGYFNKQVTIDRIITSDFYETLIRNANYTKTIPDRYYTVTFSDNSETNRNRIINEDWTLSDRYEDNSMNTDLAGTDNTQYFLERDKDDIIETTINSNEDHSLIQLIRWDNGYYMDIFNNTFYISTTAYTINPDFSYINVEGTGPLIRFTNTSTVNDDAVLISYDLELDDIDNDGNDAYAEYRDIHYNTTQDHIYKSASNTPFEDNIENKEVTIFVDYDDGWNSVYDSKTSNINVAPNRINQDMIITALRVENDTLEGNIIVGNNPFELSDNSTISKNNDDDSYILNVKYIIEDC